MFKIISYFIFHCKQIPDTVFSMCKVLQKEVGTGRCLSVELNSNSSDT